MNKYQYLLLFIFFFTFTGSVFAQNLSSIIEKENEIGAFWSVSVRDSIGEIVEEYNSDHLIIPASNQKLFTTAAVLDGLGSDFRYETHIYGDGELNEGYWDGSIIIYGSGDPTISGFMYDDDRNHVFKSLFDQLVGYGIQEVGDVIIADVSYFDEQVYPKGWDWEDLSFYYGVEINPLSFNNNAVDLIVDANGKIGNKPLISWFPNNTDFVKFHNRQTITPADTQYAEDYLKILGKNEFILRSKLPQGYTEEESLAVTDATAYFLSSFITFVNQNGIITNTNSRTHTTSGTDYSTYNILATHTSKPLSQLIEWTNKESDNFYTEMLLKTLAAEKKGLPGTFNNGINEVRQFLGRMKIDTTNVFMKDGSGLASGNLTKTSILTDFLVKMQHQVEFESFYNSLSIAGIDGTIAHRMKPTPLFNNFRGKSGYLGGVRTLCGYFITSSGEPLIVSIATNNFIGKVQPIDKIQEDILMYLYEKY